jgi:hypothetical protein
MYREILVYTSTGDTARSISEYAAVFAATLKAQLTGLVVEVDFIDYAEIEKAITDAITWELIAKSYRIHRPNLIEDCRHQVDDRVAIYCSGVPKRSCAKSKEDTLTDRRSAIQERRTKSSPTLSMVV